MRGKWVRSLVINGTLAIICLIWLVPTLGLLVSSVRPAADVLNTGWWTIFPHQDYVATRQIPIPAGTTGDAAITIEGVTATFDQWREGVTGPNGEHLRWIGNRRAGRIEVDEKQWVAPLNFTLANYRTVLAGGKETFTVEGVRPQTGADLGSAFMNSIAVTVPATLIPLAVAAFAAYG